MGDQDRARAQERARERQSEGQSFASSLIGLDGKEAAYRARERGFEPQVVPHDVDAVTADFSLNRLRIFLDTQGMVVRAHAG
jgi:hypothetical protein